MYDDILGKITQKEITTKSENTNPHPFKEVWASKQQQIDMLEAEDNDFEDEYEDLQFGAFVISYSKPHEGR